MTRANLQTIAVCLGFFAYSMSAFAGRITNMQRAVGQACNSASPVSTAGTGNGVNGAFARTAAVTHARAGSMARGASICRTLANQCVSQASKFAKAGGKNAASYQKLAKMCKAAAQKGTDTGKSADSSEKESQQAKNDQKNSSGMPSMPSMPQSNNNDQPQSTSPSPQPNPQPQNQSDNQQKTTNGWGHGSASFTPQSASASTTGSTAGALASAAGMGMANSAPMYGNGLPPNALQTQPIPNGGGSGMAGSSSGGSFGGTGQSVNRRAPVSKADIMRGLASYGSGSTNVGGDMASGGSGGFSGYGGGRDPASDKEEPIKLADFLPGGKKGPSLENLVGGHVEAGNTIQSKETNLWNRISRVFARHCGQGLLRDCIP